MQPHGYGGEQYLDAVFRALADPTRRAILARLAEEGSVTVTELARPLDMTQPAVSKHLKVLESAGLITTGKDGVNRPRTLRPAPLAAANAWLENYREYWEASFARLDDLLSEMRKDRAN